ncbi:DUF4232 domain-containing protein [Nocardia alni]|uniref:DUF4232 domain-containing protein n=1 Tax=Nocardia alni TaxID=2815723 RepID=UPI001C22FFA5|nr:DUF4232 domain-containing protein [Nocardia alni]
MKYGKMVGAAVAAAGLSVSISACQGTSSSAPSTAAVATSSASNAQPAQSVAPVQADLARCHTGDLSARLGSQAQVQVNEQGELGAAGIHYNLPLIFTNNSAHACVMSGFPGVDLIGPGAPYSLPRTGTPASVTLAPGASAHSTIYYIDPSGSAPAGETASLWIPTHLEVTPPNETTQLSVPWGVGDPVDNADKASGSVAAHITPVETGE